MSQLHLYFDDSSFNIQYSPQTAWSDNSSELWTNGNSKVVNTFPGAQLTFTFNGTHHYQVLQDVKLNHPDMKGTSAFFYGASLNDSKFAPVIDDLVQPSVTLPSSNPPTYGSWYQTPPLQPGSHKIIFNDLPMLTLDYIVVEIDQSTIFQNTLVLISDSDPIITYTGSWEQDVSRDETLQPFTFTGDYSTRSSCNPGDTLTFSFAGMAIQMWGVFDWKLIGEVTAAYIIDDQEVAQQRYQADTGSQQKIDGVQTNFLLFSKNDLSDGAHSVLINITSCTNQRFSLDYITYTPSFTSGSGASSSKPPHINPSGTASNLPTTTIVGIAVGVAVSLIAAVMVFCLYRKRRRAVSPFPVHWSAVSFTRKEEVPPHTHQPQASQEVLDLTDASSVAGTRATSPHFPDSRSTDEHTAGVPPPPYRNRNIRLAPTLRTVETATSHTDGGQT